MEIGDLPFVPDTFFEDGDLDIEMPDGPYEAIILPLVDMVLFPHMVTPIYVGRQPSLAALEDAVRDDWPLVAITQRRADLDHYPALEELYAVGTDLSVMRTLRMPDGSTSAIARGLQRVRVIDVVQESPYLIALVEPVKETSEDGPLVEAMMRAVVTMFERIVQLDANLTDESYIYAMNIKSPGMLADFIAQAINLPLEKRQELLEMPNAVERLHKVSGYTATELDVLELEDKIQAKVQQEVDRSQREYFLREQMRAIQRELGETDLLTRDVVRLREQLEKGDYPAYVRERAEEELARLAMMPPMAAEVGMVRTYLDWLLNLPWTARTEDNLDLEHAEQVLSSRHYGLKKAKERILEYIAVHKLAPRESRSTILCFVGPPGTGKTSLGRSIAEALGRKFVRVSLGGVRDEAEIRGHRRTYIGALPGRIIQTMRRAGTINPVFMLDEIDKLSADFRGDPAAALLEVLDPEQNHAFSDHYLEIPYDLSQVLFITTANYLDIPPALEDRMEIIPFPGYTDEEKMQIARRFLIPRQVVANGLQEHPPRFPAATVQAIIRDYTYEAGVRNLEREIGNLCRKAARRLAEGKRPIRTFTPASLARYLGPPRYLHERLEKEDQIGVAMGMAWTQYGGDLLPVEVALMPGKGSLTLTGQLGEVMQESAQAAYTYLRSQAERWSIGTELFEKIDIHVHLPEGGVPKDGPSGGITIATALFSAFTRCPVRHDVALTGEITLRGRVLPVGGLKAKLLAAHRAGVRMVIIPARNEPDLREIPKSILTRMEIRLVQDMEEVLRLALVQPCPRPSEEGEAGEGANGEA